MRVLYFHQYFITPEGAGGTRSYEFARHLIEQGHSVTMVFIRSAGAANLIDQPFKRGVRRGHYQGIDLIEFDIPYSNRLNLFSRTLAFIKYAIRSSKLAITETYDVLFATSTPLTAGIPGILMKIWPGKKRPFVFEVRDLWPELPKAMGIVTNPLVLWMMSILEYVSYRAADACIALSPGIQEGIQKRAGAKKPVFLIPNGCDLDLFRPDPEEAAHSTEKKPIIALFAGAHGYANGLESVLDMAAKLKEKGYEKEITILLVGDGIKKDALQKRAEAENLTNCTFMAPVSKRELATLMSKVDIGLMTLANVPAFYYGTSPNKFFDYISMGLPVVNNYPGWLKDLITGHHCGFAVQPGDAESFADALIYLYEHPNERIKFGQNARRLAEKEFGRAALAARFSDALQRVCSGSVG